MRKTLCTVLMIALVLVSILAIAVVPASASTAALADKALMLVANKGTSSEGSVTVTLAEPVALNATVSFDIDNGVGLQVNVGSYTLDTAGGAGETYCSYELEIAADTIVLSAFDGSAYVIVDSEAVTLTDAQTVSFSLSNSEDKAKQVFMDNLIITVPGADDVYYNFNHAEETEGDITKIYTHTIESTEEEGEDEVVPDFSITASADSYALIPQDDFVVSFYNINDGGKTIVTAYYGYGKRVDVPAGYELVDDVESYKIDKVESDAFVALTSATENIVGCVYVRLVNATFKSGTYADKTIGVFHVGDQVTVVADPAPEGGDINGFYVGNDINDKNPPVCAETEYTFEVASNTVVVVDYNLVTFEVLLGNYDATANYADKVMVEELGDVFVYTASNRVGYTFDGWYTDAEFQNLFTSDSALTVTFDEDQAYYAKYTAIPYSVFVASGGRIKVDGEQEGDEPVYTYEGVYGDEVTIVADEPEEGYSFIGWYAGAIEVSDEEEYTFKVTGDVSLTAKYEVNSVKVTVVNGTVDGMDSESNVEGEYYVTVSRNETIMLIPAVREGHEFIGWQIGCNDTYIQYVEYNFVVENDITVKAIYDDYVRVSVINGTVEGHASETDEDGKYLVSVQLGTEIKIIPLQREGHVVEKWFVNGVQKSGSADEYTLTAITDTTVEARFDDYVAPGGGTSGGGTTGGGTTGGGEDGSGSQPSGGCGGFIAPVGGNGGNGGNGGMLMILGVLVVSALAVLFARNGKKLVKHAPKVLGIVLCIAVLCSAIVVPEAMATEADYTETVLADNTQTIEITDYENEGFNDYTWYFPVEGFKLGDKVKVSMDVMIDRNSESHNDNWSTSVFKNLGGEMIDDALPVNKWTNLVYETRVVMIPESAKEKFGEGFAVALTCSVDGFLLMNVKDFTVTTSKLTATMLGGATLYMLPNDCDVSTEQMNSFVLVTASGKVIVLDGGTYKDYTYLKNFLHSITNKVDAWFISHFHSDHIDALTKILINKDIYIDKLYYDFLSHERLWGPIAKPDMTIDLSGVNESEYQSKYIEKYGAQTAQADIAWRYLILYDEIQKHLAMSATDPNRVIGEVIETQRGDVFTFDDVEFYILNDTKDFASNFGNNTTVNWRINTAGVDMLFLGDTGIETGNVLLEDKELIFDTDGDSVVDSSVYDCLQGCAIVQAAHHGQTGVSEAFYRVAEGDVYLYCAPEWLFYSLESGEIGASANTQCVKEREWQRQLDTVSRTYWMDGLVTIK